MIVLQYEMDLEKVRTLYRDPELFARISEHGTDPDDFWIDDEAMYYRLVNPKNQTIGIAQFEFENATTLQGHCNVLAPFRSEYAADVGRALLDWFVYGSAGCVEKLHVVIPTVYPDVIGFVKKHGFQHEGTRRRSIRKDGELVDEWLGGITRHEAFDWLAEHGNGIPNDEKQTRWQHLNARKQRHEQPSEQRLNTMMGGA